MRIPKLLKEVDGRSAKNWVSRQNQKTERQLYQDPTFHLLQRKFFSRFTESNRVFDIDSESSSHYCCFRMSTNHPRGVYQKISKSAYLLKEPGWETLLDMDKLCEEEQKEWVFNELIESEFDEKTVCLVSLSLGGRDKRILREYDLKNRKFIQNGFYIDEAHSGVIWLAKDLLLIATDFGPGTLTQSGHPAFVCLLKRNQKLSETKIVFAVDRSSLWVDLNNLDRHIFLIEHVDFYHANVYLMRLSDTKIDFHLLPIPQDAELVDVFNNMALIKLTSDWMVSEKLILPGNSIISVDIEKFHAHPRTLAKNLKPTLCYAAGENSSIESVKSNRTRIFIKILCHLQSELIMFTHQNNQFVRDNNTPFPPFFGHIQVVSLSPDNHEAILHYQSYLTPCEQYHYDIRAHTLTLIKRSAHHFNSLQYQVNIFEATSIDGAKIPYYVVSSKNLVRDGCNPTVLVGYGGFGDSIIPYYLGVPGGELLNDHFVYVEACIRGGGEFGPSWRDAGIHANKQNSINDFIAVAKSLIEKKITSPTFLGIRGGSNGGLLVAACAMQEPTLFGAVVCEVPLLDMLHYHLFPFEKIWIAEYGDPKNSAMRKVIKKYSPLENIKAKEQVNYPPFFIQTSSNDDRVHPYHARAMAYALTRQGHEVLFYEDQNGGHECKMNLHLITQDHARVHVFLHQKLGAPSLIARSNLLLHVSRYGIFRSSTHRKRDREEEVVASVAASAESSIGFFSPIDR